MKAEYTVIGLLFVGSVLAAALGWSPLATMLAFLGGYGLGRTA